MACASISALATSKMIPSKRSKKLSATPFHHMEKLKCLSLPLSRVLISTRVLGSIEFVFDFPPYTSTEILIPRVASSRSARKKHTLLPSLLGGVKHFAIGMEGVTC
ncbi:hypothetical protein BGZ76_007763 [Entomortierella beljakovae]|nr:hypothetical protein BGZ76_007763 [Entomortierella beljakovae]